MTAKLPLADLRVVDLTIARAGPTCVRQLADWGADVIRVECPRIGRVGQGGGSRMAPTSSTSIATSAPRVDLKRPEGTEVLLRLADGADVLVENMRPAVKYRLGFDYEAVHREIPRSCTRSHLRLRPGRPVRRPRRRRPDRSGHGRADERDRPAGQRSRPAPGSPWPICPPGSTSPSASSSRCTSGSARARGAGCRPRC